MPTRNLPPTTTVERQLQAIDIDVRCSLALSRALLKGFAATSAQARHALDAALDEELLMIAAEESHADAAVHGIVSEARFQLRRLAAFQDRLACELGRAIVDSAEQLAEPARADDDLTPGLRSCA